MTISECISNFFSFITNFSFFGGGLRWTYVSKREKRSEGEKERRRERSRGSIYSTDPQKSLHYCLLVRVYSLFFFSSFFLPPFSFFLLLPSSPGESRTALSASSAREKRKQKIKEKRGWGRSLGGKGYFLGGWCLSSSSTDPLLCLFAVALARKRNEGEK